MHFCRFLVLASSLSTYLGVDLILPRLLERHIVGRGTSRGVDTTILFVIVTRRRFLSFFLKGCWLELTPSYYKSWLFDYKT